MISAPAILALMKKDVLIHVKNRKALIISLAAPVIMAAFFGYVFNNATKKPTRVPVAVVDLDQSAVSKAVVAGFSGDTTLDSLITTEADATKLVRSGKRRAAIVIPPDFGKAATTAMWTQRSRPQVKVLYDPSQSFVVAIANGVLNQHIMQAVFRAQVADASAAASLRDSLEASQTIAPAVKQELTTLLDSVAKVKALSEKANGTVAGESSATRFEFAPPFTAVAEEVTSEENGVRRNYNSYAHSFAGMTVQFVLFLGIDFGIGLLMMRRAGIWQRLRVAPISRADLVLSRILSATVVSLGTVAAIYGIAIGAFGVRVDGSWAGLVAIIIAFALMNASLGLLIAAVGQNPEAARGLSILVMLILVMVGGAWVPSFVFPEWLQTLSHLTPTYWAIEGLAAMTWRGLPFADAVAPVGAMLAFSALFAAVAMWRFRWAE